VKAFLFRRAEQHREVAMQVREQIRALCLLSGGLDSQLAVCVLRDQGIEVHGVVFTSPFFTVAPARRAAAQLGIPLHEVNFLGDIVELLNGPKHGFGKCMNPCIDCHARMLTRAGEMMREYGFHFLCTGEVLNERPMSQNRQSLDVVANESGYSQFVVRPLSAKLLPPTLAEREGWVDRERLLALQGRGRKPQFQLAEQYGLKEYPSPAGGCRLTEPNFCRRLEDLKAHEGLRGERSLVLLRYGRHFRLGEKTKLIVGRHEKDNAVIEGTAELYDLVLKMEDIPGPTGLLPITARPEEIELAARICARYSDCDAGETVAVRVRSARETRRLQVTPIESESIESWRL